MLRTRTLDALWIAGILALFCLHFPHLLADFPNHSPWMADYAKYTDEGWYANAAVRFHLTGHWYLPGDFNPAVALPVWPALLAVLFHFTGVSLAAARAVGLIVLGLNLVLSFCVLRVCASHRIALLALTLLVSSPFLYAFSRLALLEPLLIAPLLLSWLLALHLPRATAASRVVLLAATGLLFCLMVLTKTTAVFLIPSTLFLIARAFGFRLAAARALALVLIAAALPWSAWFFLFVNPRYRADYNYLFAANQWPQPTTFTGWFAAFWYALHGALWISPTLALTALALLALALLPSRSAPPVESRSPVFVRNPLVPASLLVAAGYIFFAGWHNNPQPRYYQIVIYPLAFILVLAAADLLRHSRPLPLRIAGAASVVIMAAVSLAGARTMAGYIRHPDYSFLSAARSIAAIIDRTPGHPRRLLSVSADQIALVTALPALDDDYGAWDLPYRIHVYDPGWFAAWNEIDPGTLDALDALDARYSLVPIAQFPAFDDPDRNLLVLYRLDPLPAARRDEDAPRESRARAAR
ncbi:MAG: hypothetical protein WBD46_09690 [Acidobacteriaceae bacterium]